MIYRIQAWSLGLAVMRPETRYCNCLHAVISICNVSLLYTMPSSELVAFKIALEVLKILYFHSFWLLTVIPIIRRKSAPPFSHVRHSPCFCSPWCLRCLHCHSYGTLTLPRSPFLCLSRHMAPLFLCLLSLTKTLSGSWWILVWRKGNINENCLCVTVLCTIIMVHKDTSSFTGQLTVSGFDLAWFSSLSSKRLYVFGLNGAM